MGGKGSGREGEWEGRGVGGREGSVREGGECEGGKGREGGWHSYSKANELKALVYTGQPL